MQHARTLALAFTGASGMPYGLRLLECLLGAGTEVHLAYSPAAQVVAKQECGLVLPTQPREAERMFRERYGAHEGQLRVFAREDWLAPMASGSNPGHGMAVCPCSMGTAAAIAHGLSQNLIHRAADVHLKERRKLILVPRETPLGVVQLRNLTACAEAGAVVLPAMPAFYTHPRSLDDAIDFVVGRVCDQLGVAHRLLRRWGEEKG